MIKYVLLLAVGLIVACMFPAFDKHGIIGFESLGQSLFSVCLWLAACFSALGGGAMVVHKLISRGDSTQ